MNTIEELEDILSRLLVTAHRSQGVVGRVPQKTGTETRRVNALIAARSGSLQDAWRWIRGLKSCSYKADMLRECLTEYRVYLGRPRKSRDEKWENVDLLIDQDLLPVARFLAKNSGDQYSWRYWVKIFQHTKNEADLQAAREVILKSHWCYTYGFGRRQNLLDLAEMTDRKEDFDYVLSYWRKKGVGYWYYPHPDREKGELDFWQRWKELTGRIQQADEAIAKIQSAKAKERKARQKQDFKNKVGNFDGLLELAKEHSRTDLIQTAVNMIFDQADPHELQKMLISAIQAVDELLARAK